MIVFPGLGLLCVVAGVVVIVILRHRQRMAMIEKGIMPEPKKPEAHLRRGLILSFIGGGILAFFSIAIPIGFVFPNEPMQMLAFGGVILLAIGIAEIVYYGLTRSKAAPPTEKETADDAEKKTPQIDVDKRR